MKIKKGDKILVTAGKDRGKTALVENVFPKEMMVLAAGVNLFKKHKKPSGEGKPGGIVEIPRPICLGKIALICPKCGKQTRVGFTKDKEPRLRICRKCKSQF